MEKIEILSVGIDGLSLQEILEKIDRFINDKNKHYLVTVNPEFLVAAQKDKHFKEILNYADIAIADGVGLVYAAKTLGQKLYRITGVDLVGFLCELAEQKKYPVFLLGGVDDTAQKTATVLKETFPAINIVGAENGGQVSPDCKSTSDSELIEKINKAKPKILLVAFGQVKQEKWIFNNLDKLNTVKIAIGVGGTFDYICGNVKRAPLTVRNFGLEWLYRLFKEPWRKKRIFNAVFYFLFLILKQKIGKNNKKQENQN
ncbi:MAG: WecB/TagA/CpsF family glycosyltransferase [Candidatus Buchananbacteria bacterium]|nr:WecB/TagA/CpsF family glycosyltransferase [Candidatus Buchananbacteria bacterium]